MKHVILIVYLPLFGCFDDGSISHQSSTLISPVDSAVDRPVDSAVVSDVDSAVDSPVDSAVVSALDSAIDSPVNSTVDSGVDSTVDSAVDSAVDSVVDSSVDSQESDAPIPCLPGTYVPPASSKLGCIFFGATNCHGDAATCECMLDGSMAPGLFCLSSSTLTCSAEGGVLYFNCIPLQDN